MFMIADNGFSMDVDRERNLPNDDNWLVDRSNFEASCAVIPDDTNAEIEINNPHITLVNPNLIGNEVKMLYILENGEQNLVSFQVPDECCVQDLIQLLPVKLFYRSLIYEKYNNTVDKKSKYIHIRC